MKKVFLFLLFACAAISYCGADIIVFKNGDAKNAVIKEITPTEIKYTKPSRHKGPIYTIPVSDVVSINYDDGTKDTFNSEKHNPAPEVENNFDAEANNEAIMRYERDIRYIGAPTKKEARACYGLCKFDDESVLNDGNISIDLTPGVYSPFIRLTSSLIEVFDMEGGPHWNTNTPKKPFVFWYAIKAKINNLSSQTMYIDLANTFFKRGTLASPYYIPSSTTGMQSNSQGVGINLGAAVGALGIGGSLSKLASGINVGSSSTSSTVTTIYSQRVISIPPKSSIELTPQLLFPPNLPNGAYKVDIKDYGSHNNETIGINKNSISINVGQTKEYDRDSSPITFGLFLSYSFDEQFSKPRTINNTAYLSRFIGVENFSPNARARVGTKKADNLSEGFLQPMHFFVYVH